MVSKEQVKNIRERLQLTQVEFGKLLGVNGQAVFRWEKGTRNVRGPAKMIIMGMLGELEK